jgi:hypothetical protein
MYKQVVRFRLEYVATVARTPITSDTVVVVLRVKQIFDPFYCLFCCMESLMEGSWACPLELWIILFAGENRWSANNWLWKGNAINGQDTVHIGDPSGSRAGSVGILGYAQIQERDRNNIFTYCDDLAADQSANTTSPQPQRHLGTQTVCTWEDEEGFSDTCRRSCVAHTTVTVFC